MSYGIHSSYPSGSDLASFMVDNGIIDSMPVDYSQYDYMANSAATQFEKDTGYQPFLGTGTTGTYKFLANGNLVDFRGGFTQIDSVTHNGTTLVDETDYGSFPRNTYPKTWLQLSFVPSDEIVVVGKRGYSETISDDVWLALLTKASQGVAQYIERHTGAVSKIKQGDVEISYGSNSSNTSVYSGAMGVWQTSYMEVVKKYRRIRVS